jgi:hypothetical protein
MDRGENYERDFYGYEARPSDPYDPNRLQHYPTADPRMQYTTAAGYGYAPGYPYAASPVQPPAGYLPVSYLKVCTIKWF